MKRFYMIIAVLAKWPRWPDLTNKVSDLQDIIHQRLLAEIDLSPWGAKDAERNTRFNQARVSLPTFLLPPPLLWLLPRPPLAPLLTEPRGISPDGGGNRKWGAVDLQVTPRRPARTVCGSHRTRDGQSCQRGQEGSRPYCAREE